MGFVGKSAGPAEIYEDNDANIAGRASDLKEGLISKKDWRLPFYKENSAVLSKFLLLPGTWSVGARLI